MGNNKLQIQRFRTNDLIDDGGKQFEVGKNWCEDFFEISSGQNECVITLKFRTLSTQHEGFNDKVIELKLSGVSKRGDRKAYANGESGKSQIKEFFIDDLHLNVDRNLQDYFGIFKADNGDFYLYYIPKILYDNFVSLFTNSMPQIKTGEQYESIETQEERKDLNCKEFLTALRTKPFMLLAGISGTGKSRIVRKLAQATVTEALQRENDSSFVASDRWNLHSPANFQLIQVKPNWHNSMDVAGYLSNIPAPHYVFTPFVNFIVKAWMNPDVPFFLCLDEMNLAPVEEYFAEFLSAIESRSFEDGSYMTDPIIRPFNEFGNGISVSMIKELNDTLKTPISPKIEGHLRTRGLTLPKNLIVIGTVNMDETTFSFSRKVLDRAMSIEMNEVDYGSFLSSNTDEDLKTIVSAFEDGQYKKTNGEILTLNELLVDRHIEAREVINELGGTSEDGAARFVTDYLATVNQLLDGTPFKLGYRAANEALIYVRSCQEFGINDTAAALDDFTLMKILSRIEGDESKLKITDSSTDNKKLQRCGVSADDATLHGELTLLTALREIIKNKLGEFNEDITADPSDNTDHAASTDSNEKQRKSVQKIDQMISQLARDHFVSYWN